MINSNFKHAEKANEFLNIDRIKCFEFKLANDDHLIVDLTLKTKQSKYGDDVPLGISFGLMPEKGEKLYFSGDIKKDKSGGFYLPFNDYDSLQTMLEQVHAEIVEGYLIPNDLYCVDE